MRAGLICLLAGLAALPGVAADISITLRDHAVLEGRSYTLGDIADLDCPPAMDCQPLRALPLGVSPRAGYEDKLAQATLARQVRTRLPALAGKITWQGANHIRLETAALPVDETAIQGTAQVALDNWLAKLGGEARTEALPQAEPLTLPKGAVTLQARKIQPERPQARMSVWLDVYLDGRFYKSMNQPFRVSLRQSVWLPRQSIAKGQLIDCAALEQRTFEVTTLPGLAAPRCVEGSRARTALAQGKPLLQEQMESRPAVAQGETATLSVTQGSVQLESTVTVLADGRPGDTISVKPTYGTETILARVVAPGQLVAIER